MLRGCQGKWAASWEPLGQKRAILGFYAWHGGGHPRRLRHRKGVGITYLYRFKLVQVDRLPRWKLLGQEAPGNASPKNVEDAVHHLPHISGTMSASRLGRRYQGLQDRPLIITHVAGVPLPFHHYPSPSTLRPLKDNPLGLIYFTQVYTAMELAAKLWPCFKYIIPNPLTFLGHPLESYFPPGTPVICPLNPLSSWWAGSIHMC